MQGNNRKPNNFLIYESWRKKSLKELNDLYKTLIQKIERIPSSSKSILDNDYEILHELVNYIEQRRQEEEEKKNDNR